MAAGKDMRAGRLAGKVALVTGAGPGLGGVIAAAMAAEGAKLVICDINPETMRGTQLRLEELGAECLALRCDVADSASVDAMFAAAAERFGTVDILVNNAARNPGSPAESERRNLHYEYMLTPGPRRALGIITSLSDDDWLKWWGVNTNGVFYCTRAALRLMQPRRSGKIINIASTAALGAGSMHAPGYSASKAAVVSLTKTTAYDVAGANIQVNAIACGPILTPIFADYMERATEEQRMRLLQQLPLGRMGRPEEYASLAVYLASDEHYLVGQVISPNGGVVI